MHISLNKKSLIIIAFESKRKRLGFTTSTSAIIRAIEIFLKTPEPEYARPPVSLSAHNSINSEHKEKIDAICPGCSGTGKSGGIHDGYPCQTCHGDGRI